MENETIIICEICASIAVEMGTFCSCGWDIRRQVNFNDLNKDQQELYHSEKRHHLKIFEFAYKKASKDITATPPAIPESISGDNSFGKKINQFKGLILSNLSEGVELIQKQIFINALLTPKQVIKLQKKNNEEIASMILQKLEESKLRKRSSPHEQKRNHIFKILGLWVEKGIDRIFFRLFLSRYVPHLKNQLDQGINSELNKIRKKNRNILIKRFERGVHDLDSVCEKVAKSILKEKDQEEKNWFSASIKPTQFMIGGLKLGMFVLFVCLIGSIIYFINSTPPLGEIQNKSDLLYYLLAKSPVILVLTTLLLVFFRVYSKFDDKYRGDIQLKSENQNFVFVQIFKEINNKYKQKTIDNEQRTLIVDLLEKIAKKFS